jgi:hypothetical protein
VPNTSAQHARGALIVLSMLAGEMVDQVQERLNEIMVHCLGSRGREDPLLAKYGCIMLQVRALPLFLCPWSRFIRIIGRPLGPYAPLLASIGAVLTTKALIAY